MRGTTFAITVALAVSGLLVVSAADAGNRMTAVDYCHVPGHHIRMSANTKNFLCVKVYFQGSSIQFRGSYNRYAVDDEIRDSEDEYGFYTYTPDDPVLTLKI